MNMPTPVAPVAETASGMLDEPDASDDIHLAIETIGRRSIGRMNFVSRYRKLMN